MLRIHMMPRQLASLQYHELRACLNYHGLDSFKHGEDIDGLRMSSSARKSTEKPNDRSDLPEPLRVATPKDCEVYLALYNLREYCGDACKVQPVDVKTWMEREEENKDCESIYTINKSLKRLVVDYGVVYKHPARGYLIGERQATLPFSGRQSEQPSDTVLEVYRVDMAERGVPRFMREAVVQNAIWVPGELNEDTGAVIVVDAKSEKPFAVSERIGEMKIPTRSGRLYKSAAVRGQIVCIESDEYAVVKLPGVPKPIYVRLLGEWHRRGRTQPDAETQASA